jgi:hypothetical protein
VAQQQGEEDMKATILKKDGHTERKQFSNNWCTADLIDQIDDEEERVVVVDEGDGLQILWFEGRHIIRHALMSLAIRC